MYKPGWSQDHPNLQLTCKTIYIYTCKKILYAKLIYFDHPNKNVEHPNLKITKFGFNKNKSNITLTTFLQ